MGHIELAAPVVHIRYIKATPSRIGLLLNLSINEIEKILYYVKYVVTSVNEEQKKNIISQLDKDYKEKVDELDRVYDKEKKTVKENTKEKKEKEVLMLEENTRKVYEENKSTLEKEYSRVKSILANLDVGATILESDYRNVFWRYEGAFTFESGSQAVLTLLKQIDIQEDIADLLKTFGSLKGETKKKMFKKLKLLINLYISGVKPEWMVLTHLPVIPPDLRPVVQLE
jgi:DNA-directed RNA polymerase subunit beta'